MAGCCGIFQRWLSLLLYVTGIGLSSFAYHVELQKEANENYVALCDIKGLGSCTRVFNSKYGKGFGLVSLITGDEKHPLNQPNSLYGIVFYSLFGLLYLCSGSSKFMATLQFYVFFISCLMSGYLGYILYFILKDFCVVCVATYCVNFLLLLLSYCKKRSLRKKEENLRRSPMHSYGGPTYSTYTLPTVGSKDAFKKNI